MAQLKCPHCSSENVSKTTTGKVTQGAKVAGTVAVTVGGKVLGEYTGVSVLGKGVSMAGKYAISQTPIEFVCNACDSLFKATFDTDGSPREVTLKKLPMPNEIIEKEKETYLNEIKKKKPIVSAIIFALLTIYCYIFIFFGFSNDSAVAGGLQIFMGFIFGTIFLIPAILKMRKITSINHEIEECEKQSLREFKHLHKELFYQYRQYH